MVQKKLEKASSPNKQKKKCIMYRIFKLIFALAICTVIIIIIIEFAVQEHTVF